MDCMGFPAGSDHKGSAYSVGDLGLIPGSERPPGGGNGNPLQYSCQGTPMNRGAWRAAVRGVTELDMTEQLPHTYTNGECRRGTQFLCELREPA